MGRHRALLKVFRIRARSLSYAPGSVSRLWLNPSAATLSSGLRCPELTRPQTFSPERLLRYGSSKTWLSLIRSVSQQSNNGSLVWPIPLRIAGPQRNLPALRAVYRHEAAHVLLHAATKGNVPRWFQEGYAQSVSGTWNWNDGWRLHFVLLRHGQSILGDLDRELRSGLEPRTAYLLSYTAVASLHELAGDQGLSALFAELRTGQSFEASLRSVYGLTGRDFERHWRQQVLDRYGWLYLFSRTGLVWVAVAGLVLGLGVSRVRRDRERLERMVAEEEESEFEEWANVDDFDLRI